MNITADKLGLSFLFKRRKRQKREKDLKSMGLRKANQGKHGCKQRRGGVAGWLTGYEHVGVRERKGCVA